MSDDGVAANATGEDGASWEGERRNYDVGALEEAHAPDDPMELLRRWIDDAIRSGASEPTAMTIATVDPDGAPAARIVLMRRLDSGVVFFTNRDSDKGRELAARPVAAAVFHWVDLHRQVRAVGGVEEVDEASSDAYFADRPRDSQIGAWASPQSAVIAGREELEVRVGEVAARFEGQAVPRPPNWGGYRLVPVSIEFWQGRPSRLHDRLRYVAASEGGWTLQRLAP